MSLPEPSAAPGEPRARLGVRARLRASRTLAYLGPAFLVSVGYMDPGNWGTDIQGGASFGYTLLWSILLANLMAILLQALSARLGIATAQSLPECCRDRFPRGLNVFLWITAEAAAMATDLAEVLGAALAVNLLFGVPMLPATLLAGIGISLLLLLETRGHRRLEIAIIALVAVINLCFLAEILIVKPSPAALLGSLVVPRLPPGSLLIVVGIIGATVMPHNLYLHSALVQSRLIRGALGTSEEKRRLFRFALVDSLLALNGAFLVNASILIVSAAAFFTRGIAVDSIEVAHQTLAPLFGGLSSVVFAIGLLAAGLSSSVTATLAGQVILGGFLNLRVPIWARRVVTLIPALLVVAAGLDPLAILVLSQVSLSFQLPFAILPLIHLTRKREVMGDLVNPRWVTALALAAAAVIIAFNVLLVGQTLGLGAGR